jgi:hypothetical protein
MARSEVIAGLYETVCLVCHRLLGVSKDMHGLDIVEKAHKCSKVHVATEHAPTQAC